MDDIDGLQIYSYTNNTIVLDSFFFRTRVSSQMKVSENTSVAMPIKNMIGIVVAVAMGVFAYTEVTARLTSLETSRELFQADLLKKSEQKPTDQEQFMLLESVFADVEKLIETQEQNMTNKVNIEFLKEQVKKLQEDVEKLIRNGSEH